MVSPRRHHLVGICDGAASLIIASEEACSKYDLKPLARIVSWASAGVDPSIMGIGPCPAIRLALERAKLPLSEVCPIFAALMYALPLPHRFSQMALVEINEAFAAQYLSCEKQLGLDRSITNASGGAIALGHPLGASGARIMTHLTHALPKTSGKYAIGSACIGGGQGIAIVIERAE